MNSYYNDKIAYSLLRMWVFGLAIIGLVLFVIVSFGIKQIRDRVDAKDSAVSTAQQDVASQIQSLKDEIFRLETLRMFENRRQSGRYFEWKYETAQQTAKAQKILTDEGYQVELQPDGAISVTGRQW